MDPHKTYMTIKELPDYKSLVKSVSELTMHNNLKFKCTDYNPRTTPDLSLGETQQRSRTGTQWVNKGDVTDTSKFSSFVKSYGLEKQSENTLKQFIVDCVLNDG